jgi:hypothetical protein
MLTGTRVSLWKVRHEAFQVLVLDQYILTVTEPLGDGKCRGVLPNGSRYVLEGNGQWWAEKRKADPEMGILTPAVSIWNTAMSRPVGPMRVLDYHKGAAVIPDGDVQKCDKHNRYFHLGSVCRRCLKEAHKAS